MNLIWTAFIEWVYAHEDLAAGILTAIILIAALTAAIRTLYAMRHDRATTIAMNLRRDYESGMVFEGRKLAYKIDIHITRMGIKDKSSAFAANVQYYKTEYPDEFAKLVSIPALFDMMGWLVRNGCCTAIAVDEQIDWEQPYELWEAYIRKTQNKSDKEALDDKPTTMYGNFIWLVKCLQKNKSTKCG